MLEDGYIFHGDAGYEAKELLSLLPKLANNETDEPDEVLFEFVKLKVSCISFTL